jgi:hypothetical protein
VHAVSCIGLNPAEQICDVWAPHGCCAAAAAARLLKAREAELEGTVLLMFQPGACTALPLTAFGNRSVTAGDFAPCSEG